jgi:hypothetical protein
MLENLGKVGGRAELAVTSPSFAAGSEEMPYTSNSSGNFWDRAWFPPEHLVSFLRRKYRTLDEFVDNLPYLCILLSNCGALFTTQKPLFALAQGVIPPFFITDLYAALSTICRRNGNP